MGRSMGISVIRGWLGGRNGVRSRVWSRIRKVTQSPIMVFLFLGRQRACATCSPPRDGQISIFPVLRKMSFSSKTFGMGMRGIGGDSGGAKGIRRPSRAAARQETIAGELAGRASILCRWLTQQQSPLVNRIGTSFK